MIRVSFDAPSVAGETYEAEIVCFVLATDVGVEIHYAYHVSRTRDSSISPFNEGKKIRQTLTPALVHTIQNNVMVEVWSSVSRNVKTLKGEVDEPIERIMSAASRVS